MRYLCLLSSKTSVCKYALFIGGRKYYTCMGVNLFDMQSSQNFPPRILNFCHHCRIIQKSGTSKFPFLYFCNIKQCDFDFYKDLEQKHFKEVVAIE